MEQITACLECGGTDLDAVFSSRGAFTGSYHCRECDNIGPAITFEDWESYEAFKATLKKKGVGPEEKES
jgi:hypothetical protein